ncbi:Thymidylate kinase [Stieleria maiorica]|uniref:Thymidylate kinase n=1 Tax=Stieleria maiorica TaxID=2795974 RepID=A0A5B9MMD2_9BACT|nr:polyphosphate:AMP phosphotransferase [Stieleria maiorica]QEG00028.1 Thymidylate kinase [Stieleria maiorica]
MFDAAELGQRVSQREFKEREVQLRTKLLTLQYRTHELARFPVLIDFAGVEGAGKATTINMLNMWMDPRFIRTIGYQKPTRAEMARPRFWRYWRDMPPKGGIGLFLSGRYSRPLLSRVYGDIDEPEFDNRLSEIIRFENALVDDGALILKFWMHLGRTQQEERLKELEADPLRSYQVSEEDWKNHEHYDDFVAAAEHLITRTNRSAASWHIVEGGNENYRHLRVGEIIAAELSRHLEVQERKAAEDRPPTRVASPDMPKVDTVFDALDLSLSVPKSDYKKKVPAVQARLGELGRKAQAEGQSTVLVFEGPDAGGKGGAIRRTVWSLDARTYRVFQFAAPTDEERAHHYLWRFWRHLPRAGSVSVFDRSWYGRVLVERAEGFATEDEWRRAYNEINDFERQIVDHGILLLKFWMHIDKDEQLKRFKKREKSPYKHWKLTDEDWRNRELWEAYKQYGQDIIQYTSTKKAPWILVEANNKPYARLKVLQTVIDHLQEKLDGPAGRPA